MSDSFQRESRHVLVTGVPENWTEDQIITHFGGRVQRVEHTAQNEYMVSFYEVRSARKHLADNVHPNIKMKFYEPENIGGGFSTTHPTENDKISNSNSTSPTLSNERNNRSFSFHDDSKRKQFIGTYSYSPKNKTSPSSTSSGDRRISLNDDSVNMLRRISRADSDFEPTIYTIRFEKLPSTLLVPWDKQRKEITELVNKYGVTKEIAVDEIDNEARDRKATLFCSLQPGVTIDYLMDKIKSMHIETTPVIARHLTLNESIGMKLTNPGSISSFSKPSGSIDYHASGQSTTTSSNFIPYLPLDLSHIKADDRNASRTLHVRNLERRITPELLKEKFGKTHDIIDVEIKNPESPSPYAFIQFPDIISVIDTIHQYYKIENDRNKYRYKLNWGKTKTSSKLWIGKLPENITKEYIRSKIRSALILDDIQDVILDSLKSEAIILFKHKDPAMKILEQIKNKQIVFNFDYQTPVLVHIDYCSDKLQEYFANRLNNKSILPTSAAFNQQILHGFPSNSVPIPILIDTSQPPPPLPPVLVPPPIPPKELTTKNIFEISGCTAISSDLDATTSPKIDEMGYKKRYRSPSRRSTPEYERKKNSEHHYHREHHHRRSRSRERKYETKNFDYKEKRKERKRSKSMSSVSSVNSDNSEVKKDINAKIEPPPIPPTIETKTEDFSGNDFQMKRISNEINAQSLQQYHQQHHPQKLIMPQANTLNSSNVVKPKIPTPKKVYFGKPFKQAYRIVELDPRPKIRTKKNDTRILLRSWAEIAIKKLSMVSKELRNNNPAPIERPRISSGTGQTVISRVQDRLEQMKKKDESKKAAGLMQLHVDTTATNVDGTTIPTPLSGNRIETLQHTLSNVSLIRSPILTNSPIWKSEGNSNMPTPSSISRQTSLISNQNILQSIASPISNNSNMSTPKTSMMISPKSATSSMTPNPYLKRIGQNQIIPNQSGNVKAERSSSFTFPTKSNVTTPISKLVTPTTSQTSKFPFTPQEKNFVTTPTTPQNKSKLLIGQGKNVGQTLSEKKSLQEKKSTSSLYSGISTTPKMSEKHKERSRKDSVLSTSASSEYGKKERKKKKSTVQEEDKSDSITDQYLKALQNASNQSSKNYDKDKEKRRQEKKEAKRRAREMEERIMKEMKKKEKKKKKKDEYDSDSCDSIEKAHKNRVNKDYQVFLQDGYEPALGLSMYDRVKRRTSGVQNDDANKKREALELIKKKKEKKNRATTDEISENETTKQASLPPAQSSTSISISMDHDSEATSSVKSDSNSSKKKKIGIVEKERFEEKKRKKEKERKEKEKLEQKTKEKRENETKEERKARKLERKKFKESLQNIIGKNIGTTDDESDKMTNKSSKKATDSENESGHVSILSRRESLQKKEKQQKNVLKRLTKTRDTSESDEETESPKIKSKIDMTDVFCGDSSDESSSQLMPSESTTLVKSKEDDSECIKRIKDKNERKLTKERDELDKKKEEKRLRKQQKKKEQEESLLTEKEAKRKRKEEKKKLMDEQRKEEKRKAREKKKKEEMLEAEKKARKEARKLKKMAEEGSRKRKNTTDEEMPMETSRQRKEAKLDESSPEVGRTVFTETKEKSRESTLAPISATPSSSAISIVIPPLTSTILPSPVFSSPSSSSFLRTPSKSTIPKKPSPLAMPPPPIPPSPLTSPLRQKGSSANVIPSSSVSKNLSSTLDSSTSSNTEQLPPVREETPIPTPLIPYERKTSIVSLGLSLPSTDSSADEHALLLAMNQDQETTQAAEVVQKQMEQEEIGIDSYHYGAARFIDKKRESDVSSIDADFIKRRFSLDKRSSPDDAASMQSTFVHVNLQQNLQSPLIISPNLMSKQLTPDALNYLSVRHGLSSPSISPLASNSDLLRRQIQLGQIGRSQSGLMACGQGIIGTSGTMPSGSLLIPNFGIPSIVPQIPANSGLISKRPLQNVETSQMSMSSVPTTTMPLMGPPPLPVNFNPFQFPTTGSTISKSTAIPTTNIVHVSTTISPTATCIIHPTTTDMATMKVVPTVSVSSMVPSKTVSKAVSSMITAKSVGPRRMSIPTMARKQIVSEKGQSYSAMASVPTSSTVIPVHVLCKTKELPKTTPNVILPPLMAPIPRCKTRNLTWNELYPDFSNEKDSDVLVPLTTRKRQRKDDENSIGAAGTRPIAGKQTDETSVENIETETKENNEGNEAKRMRSESPRLQSPGEMRTGRVQHNTPKLGYYRSDSLLSLAVSSTGIDSDMEDEIDDEVEEKEELLVDDEKDDEKDDFENENSNDNDFDIETFPQIFSDIPPVPIPDDYDPETTRVLKNYPSIFEGILTYKEKAASIHLHSVAFYKNDFRPFLREPLTQYTAMYDVRELRIRQRCSLAKEGSMHTIFKATVLTQQVPFHLLVGVSAVPYDNLSDVDGETDILLKPFFELPNLSDEKAGCVVAANNPLQRDVALYMMYESRITDHILNDYARDLLIFLKESGMNYCLGLLCYDFLNNPSITLHDWTNRIPVSLPNYHTDPRAFRNRWLLSHPSFAPPGTPITETKDKVH